MASISQPPVSTSGEPPAGPLRVVGDAVPGHAGHVLDHRLAPAEDAVDERRLARRSGGPRRRRRAAGRAPRHTLVAALALEQRAVLLGEVELLQPGAQGALDGGVVGQVLAHRRSFGTVRRGCRVGMPVGRAMRPASPARGRPPLSRTFARAAVHARASRRRAVTGSARWPPRRRRARPRRSARSRGRRCRACVTPSAASVNSRRWSRPGPGGRSGHGWPRPRGPRRGRAAPWSGGAAAPPRWPSAGSARRRRGPRPW